MLGLVADVRSELKTPIVLFSYANPIARMGLEVFAERASGRSGRRAAAGRAHRGGGRGAGPARAREIDTIFLLSPTTTPERIRDAARLGRGFLYPISRLGVTGVRDRVADGAEALVARVKSETSLPLALGFGISHPDHVRAVGRWADAAVVGSGLVQVIAECGDSPLLVPRSKATSAG